MTDASPPEDGYMWSSEDDPHCRQVGCGCLHLLCDRGFIEHFDRKVKINGREVVYPQVKPCPQCRPQASAAVKVSRNRADMGRRLRSLRPEKPDKK